MNLHKNGIGKNDLINSVLEFLYFLIQAQFLLVNKMELAMLEKNVLYELRIVILLLVAYLEIFIMTFVNFLKL